jgi:cytochrome c556
MHVRSTNKIRSAIAALTAISLTSLLYADVPTSPAAIQKARHDHYHDLGEANKVVRDQTRASNPDFAALEKAAEHIQKASIDQGRWFPKGSGPEAGKTRALPEIWAKPADFEAAQKMFSDRAPKLLAAVKAKDTDAVRSTYRELGASCKNCHDKFRSPEDH